MRAGHVAPVADQVHDAHARVESVQCVQLEHVVWCLVAPPLLSLTLRVGTVDTGHGIGVARRSGALDLGPDQIVWQLPLAEVGVAQRIGHGLAGQLGRPAPQPAAVAVVEVAQKVGLRRDRDLLPGREHRSEKGGTGARCADDEERRMAIVHGDSGAGPVRGSTDAGRLSIGPTPDSLNMPFTTLSTAGGSAHGVQLGLRQAPRAARSQASQFEPAVAAAVQAADRVPDRLAHPPHLTVAALVDTRLEPPPPQPHDLGRGGAPVLQLDTLAQRMRPPALDRPPPRPGRS